jgi:hypothetical protein
MKAKAAIPINTQVPRTVIVADTGANKGRPTLANAKSARSNKTIVK